MIKHSASLSVEPISHEDITTKGGYMSVGALQHSRLPIEKVIFNEPATIVIWSDGTKTVVKCDKDDTFSKVTGLALCYMKKCMGNRGRYNDELKKWCYGEEVKNDKQSGS